MTSHALKSATPASTWRNPVVLLIIVWAVLGAAYHETAAAMFATWMRSDTYAHAVLVPPIVLWLVWRRRAALLLTHPRPWPLMLLPITAAALLWLVGDLVVANSAAQLAFTAMVVLAVPLVLGRQLTTEILFPLAFSFFAVKANCAAELATTRSPTSHSSAAAVIGSSIKGQGRGWVCSSAARRRQTSHNTMAGTSTAWA